MKKTELKRLLKPMVKECIKECLYEEGILSSVVSEVVKGMSGNIIHEKIEPVKTAPPSLPVRNKSNALNERKQKLLDAIGKDAYGGIDLFEGTTPAPSQRTAESSASNPLGEVAPGDPGVDISGIVELGGKNWKAFMG